MNRYLKPTLAVLVLLMNMYLSAQSVNPPAMPSPNATGLGLYGEMPVSYFTGIPDISIPLYEIKGNKVHLPLTLSYHAAGLQPDVHPGWVGNGWSLQAGGVITRKVNGLIDEYKKSFCGTQGYYFNYADLNTSTWSSTSTLSAATPYGQVLPPANPAGVQDPYPLLVDVDVQPDEFDFNFLGMSGKFYLDQHGQWQVQSDKALKVVFNAGDFVTPFVATAGAQSGQTIDINDLCKTFGKFTIIDEAGNQYIFGSTDANNTAIEFSDAMVPQAGFVGASLMATSWYLSQIISADNTETINLSYVRGPFTSNVTYSYQALAFTVPGGNSSCNPEVVSPGGSALSGTVVAPVYLTTISMPSQGILIDLSNVSATTELPYIAQGSTANYYGNVYIEAGFTYPYPSYFPSFYTQITNIIPYFSTHTPDPNYINRFIWLQLNSIRVVSTATNQTQRTILLNYSSDVTKRLRLNSLDLIGSDQSSIESNSKHYYSFTYNATALPAYLTIWGDHWGFNNYNGSNGLFSGTNNDYFTPRQPDPTGVQTQAEILTGITYPTGGTTAFTYEPNTYYAVVDRTTASPTPVAQTGVAGGLRIRQVTSSDGYNPAKVRTYYYVQGYTAGANPASLPSSGVLDSKPQYSFTTTGTAYAGQTFTDNYISSNSVVPVSSNTMGTYIGYSAVVELNADNSYTIYKFTNHDNGYGDQVPVNSYNAGVLAGFHVFSSYYFERGQLMDKTTYNAAGFKVSEEAKTWTLTQPGLTVNSVSDIGYKVCDYNNIGAYSRSAYIYCYSPFVVTQDAATLYASDNSNTSASATTTLAYDSYKNIAQQTIVNSKGQTETTSYTYAPSLSNGDLINPYTVMLNMNNVSALVQKLTYIGGNAVSGEVHTYKLYGAGKVYNDAYYTLETATPLASVNAVNWSSTGPLSMDGHFVKKTDLYYDAYGNISTLTNTGSDPTAYLWDYNHSYAVAKVSNANNIYASGQTGNPVITEKTQFSLPLSLNTTFSQTVNLTATGPVTLTFGYINTGLNSSSTLNWRFIGSGYYTGNLCYATPTSTTSCGATSNTVTLNNLPPASNSLLMVETANNGGLNVYGYTMTVQYPVLQYAVIPAASDIAYTSFEADDPGNWAAFTGSVISMSMAPYPPTGRSYYNMTASTGLSKSGVTSGTTYTISYWSMNGMYSIGGGTAVSPAVTGKTIGSWTYYEHKITATGTTITINGSGAIDEVRLYPSTARMTTYTYTPTVGLSSQCDINNRILYYDYDNFGRLMDIRDQDGNVVKGFDYKYQANYNQ